MPVFDMYPKDLNDKSDAELICLSDNKDALSVLILRYYNIIRVKSEVMAKRCSVDADDLMQEGYLGLINAIGAFDYSRNVRFSTFAETCINNKIKSAALKNPCSPQDSTASLDDLCDLDLSTPESIFIEKENIREIYSRIIELLSDKEWKIFSMHLSGFSYGGISEELNISVKSVDNAIQRVRRKLKSLRL